MTGSSMSVVVPAWGGRAGSERRGRVVVDGEDVVFVAPAGLVLRIARDDVDASGRRTAYQAADDGSAYRLAFGSERAMERLSAAPRAPASLLAWGRAAVPTWWRVLAVLIFAATVAHWAMWAFGVTVPATVVSLSGGRTCVVAWSDADSHRHETAVDCPRDIPTLGSTIPIRAVSAPFDGQAWADLPLADFGLGTVLLVTLPLLIVELALEGWYRAVRARRRAGVVLVPSGGSCRDALADAELNGAPERGLAPSQADDLRSLARRVALAQERTTTDRLDELPTAESGPSGTTVTEDLATAVGGTGIWWPSIVIAIALVVFGRDWPTGLRSCLALGAAAWFLWRGILAALLYKRISQAWRAPFTSEWEYAVITLSDPGAPADHDLDVHLVLLFLGDMPRWVVTLADRPPQEGTALVRGDLTDGGYVHLAIEGRLWRSAGPVQRATAQDARALRLDLLDELR